MGDRPDTRAPLSANLSPSPWRSGSTLSFRTTQPGALRVAVYDAQGRSRRVLLDERDSQAGPYTIAVDGNDDRGASLRNGLYFVRITAAEGSSTGRFILLR